MPFGLLWCCYMTTLSNLITALIGHQCLSAFCGVVTAFRCAVTPGNFHVTNAFRPFVVLLRASGTHHPGLRSRSPMPFGLLWCCYPPVQRPSPGSDGLSPMPFGLLWCCYDHREQLPLGIHVTNAFRPFVVLLLNETTITAQKRRDVTNAFRPFVVLLHRPVSPRC